MFGVPAPVAMLAMAFRAVASTVSTMGSRAVRWLAVVFFAVSFATVRRAIAISASVVAIPLGSVASLVIQQIAVFAWGAGAWKVVM